MQLGVLAHITWVSLPVACSLGISRFPTIRDFELKSSFALERMSVFAGSTSVLKPADCSFEQLCRTVPDLFRSECGSFVI